MTIQRRPLSVFFVPCAVGLFLLACLAWPIGSQAADQTRHIAQKAGDETAKQHDIVEGPHVEGHIAFLHAELGITDEQETLWTAVATAMRQDVDNLNEAQTKVASETHSRLNAIQYLQNRVMFAKLRAQGEARFLQALQPLYETFSERQKRVADELLIPNAPDER